MAIAAMAKVEIRHPGSRRATTTAVRLCRPLRRDRSIGDKRTRLLDAAMISAILVLVALLVLAAGGGLGYKDERLSGTGVACLCHGIKSADGPDVLRSGGADSHASVARCGPDCGHDVLVVDLGEGLALGALLGQEDVARSVPCQEEVSILWVFEDQVIVTIRV